jgi:glycerol-3-phosphate dehydrogenase
MPVHDYDLIVVGGGLGGSAIARARWPRDARGRFAPR